MSEKITLNIEKNNTALVVIDLQKGMFGRKTEPYEVNVVISNAAKIADEFRKNQMPVFLVNVSSNEAERLKVIADESWQMKGGMPADWSELVPELNVNPTDIKITKKQWGAFYGTELDLQLRRRGIKTIVLCGISTNVGVESTARFAYEYGYNQIFPEDAMAAMAKEQHESSIKFTFPRIGLVRTTKEVIDAIKK